MFVEAVFGVRHWVIGHRLAVFLTRTLARIWRDGEAIFVYRNCICIRRKGVATENGWLCSEIGVFSHMSREVELLYDHSGVKLTF